MNTMYGVGDWKNLERKTREVTLKQQDPINPFFPKESQSFPFVGVDKVGFAHSPPSSLYYCLLAGASVPGDVTISLSRKGCSGCFRFGCRKRWSSLLGDHGKHPTT